LATVVFFVEDALEVLALEVLGAEAVVEDMVECSVVRERVWE
jgi:hypothetical protein